MGRPLLFTLTSQPTPQPGSPLNMACFPEAERQSGPCSCQQPEEMGGSVSCLSDPKECLLHVEMHPAPINTFTWVLCPFGCGSQSREAPWVPVNMQTPEPLPHFLGQNLWEIQPKSGHFAHVSQVIRLEENILWSNVNLTHMCSIDSGGKSSRRSWCFLTTVHLEWLVLHNPTALSLLKSTEENLRCLGVV